MLTTDPRTAIHGLPFAIDAAPHEQLLVAGFDLDGRLLEHGAYPLAKRRPLDAPILDSSLWGDAVAFTVAVVYSETAGPDLLPLLDAWTYRNRVTAAAAWAGRTRWRSLLCSTECCAPRGHRYAARVAGHDDFDALAHVPTRDVVWRKATWDLWRRSIRSGTDTLAPADAHALASSLHDIPVRDAVLALSAIDDGVERDAITAVLQHLAHRSWLGTGTPVHTCLAAMHYLDNDLGNAERGAQDVLDVEEYSLARLLMNGLDMRAPASLLARSFAHFRPVDLLALDAA